MVLYRNHMVSDQQGSAAHEIKKIIESPLVYKLEASSFRFQPSWWTLSRFFVLNGFVPQIHRKNVLRKNESTVGLGSKFYTAYIQNSFESGFVNLNQ